ncbi:hypothetical protein ACTFIW_003688 [Dictyostelium discoideum]
MNLYKKSFLPIILLCNLIINVHSYGEGDGNGLPIWQERESLNLLNAVRFDPVGYKNYFMSSGYNNMGNVFANNIYPATNPVYYNSVLNSQARYHSTDMGVNNCFSHSNCDGTSITARFNAFNANCMTGWGENLSAGFSNGVLTQNSLICETPPYCVNDGNNDGHRSNMMVSRWVAAGVGFYYAPSSTYKYYWSQDYKDATCEPQTSPIYSGSHSFWPSASVPMFHVSYYNKKGESLSSARVVFSSGAYGDLNLAIGSTNKGFYTFFLNGYVMCDSYIFEFATTNGNVYRYPDTGSLSIVTSSGSCSAWSSNYIQGTVSQSTTQPPVTQTPTQTQTPTPTPTQTQTQTSTPTPTPTPTPTQPQTQTQTQTSTPTPTETPTETPNSNENSSSSSTLIDNSSTNSELQSSESNDSSTSDKSTSSNNNNNNNSESSVPGGINNNSQSEDSNSNQILPNLIVPFLLGLLIKILLY